MSASRVEELIRSAEILSDDEKLELAQQLIQQARHHGNATTVVDLNSLVGTLALDEDPMSIQERIRRE